MTIIAFDAIFVITFLGKLFVLHMWLASHNITFYEHHKNAWGVHPDNPYDR